MTLELSTPSTVKSAPTRPNLFRFATSELSQDAVICWIIAAADLQYRDSSPELHQFAQYFVSSLLAMDPSCPSPADIKSVKVLRQAANIDILCRINDDILIVIEDKVGTKQHSDQLTRYKTYVTERWDHIEHTVYIYLQTGDQPNYDPVKSAGYFVLHRRELIEHLDSSIGMLACKRSDILDDFAGNLRRIESLVRDYASIEIRNWGKNARIGFVSDLVTRLRTGRWAYHGHRTGGYYAYHSENVDVGDATIHMLAVITKEVRTLFFKIDATTSDVDLKTLRKRWTTLLTVHGAEAGLPVGKMKKHHVGQRMTAAILTAPFPLSDANDKIDIKKTVETITRCQRLIETCRAAAAISSIPAATFDPRAAA